MSAIQHIKTKVTIRSVTEEILESLPVESEFSTVDLQKQVTARMFRKTGRVKRPFPDTVLRYLRYARKEGAYDFRCVSREKSLYVKERL